MTRGSGLHNCSNDGENSREDQVVTATDLVGDVSSRESADEATALKGGNNVCLEIGEGNTRHLRETVSPEYRVSFICVYQCATRDSLLLEGFHGQDTTDDTGVHTEKHATEASLSMLAVISISLS